MKLSVIGSSSEGNGYIIHNNDEALIIETGCKFAKVKQALNFDVSKIVGALVSHSHKDHSGYALQYAREGVKVYSNPETLTEIGLHHNFIPVEAHKSTMVGSFKVMAFDMMHDVRTYGFLVEQPACGRFVFITDTFYSPFTFKGLNQIIIEANYSQAIIESRMNAGSIDKTYYDRVLRSHMSLETAIGFLQANDLTAVNNIVLIHLSDGNSNTKQFKQIIEAKFGYPVTVADKGVEMEFNKTNF